MRFIEVGRGGRGEPPFTQTLPALFMLAIRRGQLVVLVYLQILGWFCRGDTVRRSKQGYPYHQYRPEIQEPHDRIHHGQ